jgi:Secretion system C-terminal sorting domain
LRNIYKLLHVIALVSIYFCFGSSQLNAQTVPFTMSSVGEFPETPSVSAAIQFTSSNSCIDVQTGVAVLEGERGTGLFAINCELPSNINTLGINVYPNPSVSQAKIKFIHTPPLTETFNVSVVRIDGVILMTSIETGYSLFVGKSIDVSRFAAGTYIVKLESTHYVDAVQFIKTNN